MRLDAFAKSDFLALWVATIVPFPGRASPIASMRQFIEFAVNMPEHEPHVGHALRSMSSLSASETLGFAPAIIASMRSSFLSSPSESFASPASIGPPDTKIAGMFMRMAAIIIPGVILSQLEMQIMASAQWAVHMYSTLSAISSREGSE